MADSRSSSLSFAICLTNSLPVGARGSRAGCCARPNSPHVRAVLSALRALLEQAATHRSRGTSEADVTVLNWQKEHWQPVAANEGWSLMSADSTTELDELARRVRLLQG
jgi:predicted kinase